MAAERSTGFEGRRTRLAKGRASKDRERKSSLPLKGKGVTNFYYNLILRIKEYNCYKILT
jgi:hypothetical protein